VIGFTGGIGLARTNLVLIKGASVLGVRAGEAVRKNPVLGEVRLKALTEWAEAGKIRPNVLAPAAAGTLRAGDAASDRPQSHRPRGADDAVRSNSLRRPGQAKREAGPITSGAYFAKSWSQACHKHDGWWLWVRRSPGRRRRGGSSRPLIYTSARPTTGNNRACRTISVPELRRAFFQNDTTPSLTSSDRPRV